MSKQDRQGARTPADLERKYNFDRSFAEIMGIATDARSSADEAKNAAEEAKRAAENAAGKELTPEEVFNALTDNGVQEGIYRDTDGNIYINASYIKGGELVADLIKAGVLQSKDGETFVLDLDNNTLKGKFAELTIEGKTVDDISTEIADALAKAEAAAAEAAAKAYADDAAYKAAANAVAIQTQEDIFNKLTNDGAEQGIYLKDDKIYINANYIAVGIISAALVQTGCLQSKDNSFYLDLDNGTLKLVSNGKEVMKVDGSGAKIAGWDINHDYLGNARSGLNGSKDIVGDSMLGGESQIRFFAGGNNADTAVKYMDVKGAVNTLGFFDKETAVCYMVANTSAHQVQQVSFTTAAGAEVTFTDSEIATPFHVVRTSDTSLQVRGQLTTECMNTHGISNGALLTVKIKFDIQVPSYQVLDDGTLIAKYAVLGGYNIADLVKRIEALEAK